MIQLPKGYYAVAADFESGSKDTFTYRGVSYAVSEGVNLFATPLEALEAAADIPDTVLDGLDYDSFDTPVILFSVGTHRIDKLRIEKPIALLGEKAGVSPNLAADNKTDAPVFNPERTVKEEETVLYGGYWYGTMRIIGTSIPKIILDGFYMEKARFADGRVSGECDCEIILRNLYHTSPCLHTIYSFSTLTADTPMHRSILLENVRLEKNFDELGYGRLFMYSASNKTTFRNLCIDGTTQLFGFTNIPRTDRTYARNTALTETVFEDCYIAGLGGENGISFHVGSDCPEGFGYVMRAENSVFKNAARQGEAAFQPNLENDNCRLELKDCYIIDDREGAGAAIAIRGEGDNVILENCTIEGYRANVEHIAPPPTTAPDFIKNESQAWTTDAADPHRVVGTDEADFSALDAYYEGCTPYYGDLHTHSNCGGTSDGQTPLSEWVGKMDALNIDFAIMVDHRQMRGYFLPEWDDTRFLYGTEPGTVFSDLAHLPNNSLHYNMIFPHKYGLAMVLANFPEFKFKGDELTGSFGYPSFTKERFKELNEYIRSIGGMLVHAHPKLLLASNDPLDYYCGEYSYLETIVNSYGSHGAFRACDLWEKVLATGVHMYASGGSDTHGAVTNSCLSTFYTKQRYHKDFVDRMYVGDFAVGGVGIKMMVDGHPMGSRIAYKDGMKLVLRVGDFHSATFKENTAYMLQILSDEGVVYESTFNGKEAQAISLEVQKRRFYRVVIWDITHCYRVCVSNPIWLDLDEDETAEDK